MKNSLFLRTLLLLILVQVVPGSWVVEEADALPAFARKYGVKCTVCHVQFPKLREFGIAFKNRGYRMPGEEGAFLWEDKVFPIAAIGRFGYKYEIDKSSGTKEVTSEGVDGEVEIFSGGTLGPRLSYFIDALTVDNAALVQFDDILANSALNIKAGVFNVDNYYLSHPRRLTESTYLVQTSADRDDNVTFSNTGVELNGQFEQVGFRYIVGAGNNTTGAGPSSERFGTMYYMLLNQALPGGHKISFLYRADSAGSLVNKTDTYTVGGNIDLHFDKLTVVAGAYQFYGHGPALNFMENGRLVQYAATSGVVEGTYEFTEKWLALARFDWHDVNNSVANEQQYVASLQYHIVPNVKLNLELVRMEVDQGGNPNRMRFDQRIARFNVRFGF